MQFDQFSSIPLRELQVTLGSLNKESCKEAVTLIHDANRIFVLGLGRVKLMLSAFAMRLMHMGKEVYVVGDTITPNYQKGDLLIVGTASGATLQLNNITQKAQSLEGNILAITATQGSPVTEIADACIIISAPSKDQLTSSFTSEQPMASLFEQSMLLLGDSLVLALMAQSNKKENDMFTKHANLE